MPEADSSAQIWQEARGKYALGTYYSVVIG